MRPRLGYLVAALPVVVFGAVLVYLIVIWLTGLPWRVGGTPAQPIQFQHNVHVSGLQLQCQYCHRNVESGPNAWVPSVELCMDCHSTVTAPNSAMAGEIAKLRGAWSTQQPIQWVKVHQMPNHVHFTHQPHIQRGFDCSVCHGDVKSMTVISQVRSLRMGDCVECHRQNGGTTDCFKCHY
jgi:Cytochrome c7 and related cytochrome c